MGKLRFCFTGLSNAVARSHLR